MPLSIPIVQQISAPQYWNPDIPLIGKVVVWVLLNFVLPEIYEIEGSSNSKM